MCMARVERRNLNSLYFPGYNNGYFFSLEKQKNVVFLIMLAIQTMMNSPNASLNFTVSCYFCLVSLVGRCNSL